MKEKQQQQQQQKDWCVSMVSNLFMNSTCSILHHETDEIYFGWQQWMRRRRTHTKTRWRAKLICAAICLLCERREKKFTISLRIFLLHVYRWTTRCMCVVRSMKKDEIPCGVQKKRNEIRIKSFLRSFHSIGLVCMCICHYANVEIDAMYTHQKHLQ